MTERGETTRQQLLDAATAVFSELGYAGATTKQIARAAGVSEGTIYRHFTDKRELFTAVFMGRNAANFEAVTRLPDLAGTKTVRENLLFLVKAIEDVERDVAPLRAAASTDADLAAALGSTSAGGAAAMSVGPLAPLARYLEAEKRLGRVRSDVDATSAALALFAIPFAAVTLGRLARRAGAAGDVDMIGAVDVVLAGVLPPN